MKRIAKGLISLFRREVLRDRFLLEAKRWFKDDGDNTLRLNYPLNAHSVVWDLGGYKGDFAQAIHQRYGCKVYVFEPMPEFYEMCQKKFATNNDITVLGFGLSDAAGYFEISNSDDASSFIRLGEDAGRVKAELRSIIETFSDLGMTQVDLIKINIEGGEYDVLNALIESRLIEQFKYVQVQFHNFVKEADSRRNKIRDDLSRTHQLMWDYEFVWESWELKK